MGSRDAYGISAACDKSYLSYSSMQVSLYIGSSFEAAWENVLLPWFETAAPRAFEEAALVAVVTPFRSHAHLMPNKLLAHGISLLGVKFPSPAQLREILVGGSGLNVSLREHLRLLLATAAEEITQEKPGSLMAGSVVRDPDNFLRAFDQLGTAGWDIEQTEELSLREIA